MQAQEVKELLLQRFANVEVEGEGAKFHLTIVSSEFEGLNPVKRQQLVYGCLTEQIASGVIHAVTMSLSTD